MRAADVGIWVAIVTSALAMGKQIYDIYKKRHTERHEIEVALDKSPLVREQLELGNVGEAVRHLNAIINSQAEHIDRQDERIDEQQETIKNLSTKLARAQVRIRELEQYLAEHEGPDESNRLNPRSEGD